MKRDLKNLRRLSGAACRKIPSVLDLGARALRDVILAEEAAKQFPKPEAIEAAGHLNCAQQIAVALGVSYRAANLTDFSLKDWYQACGLTDEGELYELGAS